MSRYIPTTETAGLVRKTLAKAFPRGRFSVRSHKYAGGSSIRVTWEDGPTVRAVEHEAGHFHGAEFDGMTDLQTLHDTRTPDGEMVHYGNHYIFFERRIHPGRIAEAEAYILRHCRCEGEAGNARFGNESVRDLAWGVAASAAEWEPIEIGFRRRVMREEVAR